MKSWFSAKELAGVNGMPGTTQNVTVRAKKNGWQYRERQGQGGGKEYHITSLPEETQQALKAQNKTPLSVVEVKGEKPTEEEKETISYDLTHDEMALVLKYRQMSQQQKVQSQTIVDVIAQPEIKESNSK